MDNAPLQCGEHLTVWYAVLQTCLWCHMPCGQARLGMPIMSNPCSKPEGFQKKSYALSSLSFADPAVFWLSKQKLSLKFPTYIPAQCVPMAMTVIVKFAEAFLF